MQPLALEAHQLLTTGSQLLRKAQQTSATLRSKGATVHVVLHLLEPLREVAETLVQLATSESTIQEPADVGDYRLMGIHVPKLPHQPRGARGAFSDPTPNESLLKSTGHIDLQAVVCRWYEIGCFIMDQRPQQVCPLVLLFRTPAD